MIGQHKEEAAPDLIKPIIGFRSWELRDNQLSAPYTAKIWSLDVNQATCRGRDSFGLFSKRVDLHPEKPAPQASCSCGFYAYHRPEGFKDRSLYNEVHGAIQAWGRVELHQTGFRAQFAKPILLALPPRPRLKWSHRSLYWVALASLLGLYLGDFLLKLSSSLYLLAFLGAYLPIYLDPPLLKGWWQLRRRTKRAAKKLGLPLVSYSKLETEIAAYGTSALDIYPELDKPEVRDMDDNFLA